MSLTPEQKALLHECIDAAQGFTDCRYLTSKNEPNCVIGQLCVRRGVSIERLADYDELAASGSAVSATTAHREHKEVQDFQAFLLMNLQSIWDSGSFFDGFVRVALTEDTARAEMHRIVDES